MPKMKTHRASAKRYRVTGSGKLVRRKAFKKHLLVNKSSKRLRQISGTEVVHETDERRVKLALPYPQYLR